MLMRYKIVVNERSYIAASVSGGVEVIEVNTAHSSGLPLGRQLLQLLVVTELDKDVDRPFVVILRLVYRNLAGATDSYAYMHVRI